MVTKTTILAVRTLVLMGRQPANAVRSPRHIAETLHESPTYLAKVTRLLVKAGILGAERGTHGGVFLAKRPSSITLLEIVEACQGAIASDHCRPDCDRQGIAAYFEAAEELRAAIVGVLSRWSLKQLLDRSAAAGAAGAVR